MYSNNKMSVWGQAFRRMTFKGHKKIEMFSILIV